MSRLQRRGRGFGRKTAERTEKEFPKWKVVILPELKGDRFSMSRIRGLLIDNADGIKTCAPITTLENRVARGLL